MKAERVGIGCELAEPWPLIGCRAVWTVRRGLGSRDRFVDEGAGHVKSSETGPRGCCSACRAGKARPGCGGVGEECLRPTRDIWVFGTSSSNLANLRPAS